MTKFIEINFVERIPNDSNFNCLYKDFVILEVNKIEFIMPEDALHEEEQINLSIKTTDALYHLNETYQSFIHRLKCLGMEVQLIEDFQAKTSR